MNLLANEKIGFIGAGNVGVTLGAYFNKKGLTVAGFYSKSIESARKAARITGTLVFSDIGNLVKECNIIFITTPDDQIKLVWNELALHNIEECIICHTSGSSSSDIFTEKATHCVFGYSVHPMFTFTSRNGETKGLEYSYFTIEGDSEQLQKVLNIFSTCGNKTIFIDKNKKTLYHLANVMVSNMVLSLLSIADEFMNECGIDYNNSIESLMPLIISNIENIKHKGFITSLTGPIERNDVGTVSRHLETIPNKYHNIYSELSMKLLELAKDKYPKRDYSDLIYTIEEYQQHYRQALINKNHESKADYKNNEDMEELI